MKTRTSALLVILLLLTATRVSAQVSSPAFDPNCYQPTIGNGVDTVQGHDTTGNYGARIIATPPAAGQTLGGLLIQGLPGNVPFLSAVETGANFDLHQIRVTKKLNFKVQGAIRWVHLHSPRYTDMLTRIDGTSNNYRVYWQQEDGGFDSSLYTEFHTFEPDSGWEARAGSSAYVTPLTQDTVDDFLQMAFAISLNGHQFDSSFLTLFRGGESLFRQGHVARQDSLYLLGVSNNYSVARNFSQGDWRGVGRSDLIAPAVNSVNPRSSNWFYYRNDPPFSMKAVANALTEDTVFLASENAGSIGSGYWGADLFSMRALPKAPWDHSEDFMPASQFQDRILIFRGGPDFGSKHLFIDSAEAVLYNPSHYDAGFQGLNGFGGGILNCSDMSGSGYALIGTDGNILQDNFQFFYLLGRAADDKVDMYFHDIGAGSVDTLNADGNNLTDILESNSTSSFLELLHGTTAIPVHLNPRYSVNETTGLSEGQLEVYPNPAEAQTMLRVSSSHAESVQVTIRDMLGRAVWHEERRVTNGSAQLPIRFGDLTNGTYVISVDGSNVHQHSKIVVLH